MKDSTSDLLVANCDEFIFYDELVHDRRRAASPRADAREAAPGPRRGSDEERGRREEMERRRLQGVEIAYETFEALMAERGDSGKIWASVLKEAIKRRNPGFSEGAYGFRTFGNLLKEAQALRLLGFGRDEKSGAYVFRGAGTGTVAAPPPMAAPVAETPAIDHSPHADETHDSPVEADPAPVPSARSGEARRRGGRRGRKADTLEPASTAPMPEPVAQSDAEAAPARRSYFEVPAPPPVPAAEAQPAAASKPRAGRKAGSRSISDSGDAASSVPEASDAPEGGGSQAAPAAKPARKTALKTARKTPARRPRAASAGDEPAAD